MTVTNDTLAVFVAFLLFLNSHFQFLYSRCVRSQIRLCALFHYWNKNDWSHSLIRLFPVAFKTLETWKSVLTICFYKTEIIYNSTQYYLKTTKKILFSSEIKFFVFLTDCLGCNVPHIIISRFVGHWICSKLFFSKLDWFSHTIFNCQNRALK